MLNSNSERELAYLVLVDNIEPITGSDNCEAAVIGGWRVMVRKGTFKPGDLAIYFEIDSKVPETETFAFLAKKHYKVKTQKYTFGGKGNFISQGLIMAPKDFGWTVDDKIGVRTSNGNYYQLDGDSRFLTKELGVIYATAEDNVRKGKGDPNEKYKRMAQRNAKLATTSWWRWLYKRTWGKKLLFMFFGKKNDKPGVWPSWVSKTDEERIQNMPWILQDKSSWVATEKIDGTSTTFTLRRKAHRKHEYEFYVCSRNVAFVPGKKEDCFYESNVYLEMAKKYNIREKLTAILEQNQHIEWITLQGETYGGTIQKRDYSTQEHFFAGFNLITPDQGRWNSVMARAFMSEYDIPWVPIVDMNFILPDTVDELLEIATDKSSIDGLPREGLVFRSEDGKQSFKAVSTEYLLSYHAG